MCKRFTTFPSAENRFGTEEEWKKNQLTSRMFLPSLLVYDVLDSCKPCSDIIESNYYYPNIHSNIIIK